MHLDAIDLRNFYARRIGLMVRRLLRPRFRAFWPDVEGLRVFGLGYASPYLAEFRTQALCTGALAPVRLGALPWPERAASHTALVDETELPLDDEAADRILLVHMLEWSEHPHALLREIWRVLAPNGRILVAVPNRRGLWARMDSTPFGYGSPFSRSQLTRLLKDAMFQPESWHYVLHLPPFNWRLLTRWPDFWERAGDLLLAWPFRGSSWWRPRSRSMRRAAREPVRRMRRRVIPVPAGAVTPRLTREQEDGLLAEEILRR
ncbi:methyltransferase domain-containing protein [Methyloceanibacter stevinii]|uniref:methyltransferase domain-containing protein n=1 Tax=Methyloceanibacter stevinii TaxID=1774970 RepID=UPI001FCE0940|nr:methyltransferase domain-containing protein [Methyloceanibacter stevinii]